QERKRRLARMEGLERQPQHHRAVLPDRVQHHGSLGLRDDLAHDVDAFGLQALEVRQPDWITTCAAHALPPETLAKLTSPRRAGRPGRATAAAPAEPRRRSARRTPCCRSDAGTACPAPAPPENQQAAPTRRPPTTPAGDPRAPSPAPPR